MTNTQAELVELHGHGPQEVGASGEQRSLRAHPASPGKVPHTTHRGERMGGWKTIGKPWENGKTIGKP